MKRAAMFAMPVLVSVFVWSMPGCAEEGEAGSTGVDCGDHGSKHEDHCHCDPGYLFDSVTCVSPGDIDRVCEEEGESSDGGEEQETEEHAHASACECPVEGTCPCDHGEIEDYAGKSYCVPNLHEEE